MAKSILLLTLLFNSVISFAQTVLQPADMKYDLAILKATWQNVHAGLYRYNTPAQMDQYFKELDARTAKPLTLREFYIRLSQLNTKLKCGHSYVSFYNNKKAIKNELYSYMCMPLLFKVIDNRFIITHHLTQDKNIQPGDEIVSINGITTKTIIDSLLTVSRADGNNGNNKKLDNISVYPSDLGIDDYCLFDVFFPLFFKENINATDYTLVINSNGITSKQSMQGISKHEREKMYSDKYGAIPKEQNTWYVKKITKHTVLLRIGDFSTYNWKFDFNAYLDSIFTDFRKYAYSNLIIDIRQNEGGADEARDAVLSYLSEKSFGCANPVRRLYRFQSIIDSLKPNLVTWDDEFKADKKGYVKTNDGYYEKENEKWNCTEITPKANYFKGNIYLITDATNSSTTFTMANYLKQNKIATLVGETTGGTQQGINGGQIFFFYLPNSKIEMDVPLIWQRPVTDKPDEGIKPDYEVHTTPADIAGNKDPQLDFILNKLIPAGSK